MGNNLPPRFKFKDTYNSISVPPAFQQYLPTQQQLETEFNEEVAQEEALPTVDAAVDDVKVISTNFYVQSNTGNVGIGTASPSYALDVVGNANVGAMSVTSISIKDDPNAECKFNFTNSDWLQQAKVRPTDTPSSSDYFGQSVSISSDGNTAIVGVQRDDDRGTDSGSAYIFIRSGTTWIERQKLTAGTDAANSDYFGYSVSISGDGNTVIVGAYYDDDNGQGNSGSAYIFVRSDGTWTQQQKLTAGTDAGSSDQFGYSVSISGDGNTAIIGAYLDDDNAQGDSGSAYIFVRSDSDSPWTQQAKLTAGADAGSGDYFGYSVSVSSDGNTAIVGAHRDDDNAQSNSGSAYIFVRSGSSWTLQQKLTAGTDAGSSDYFGMNVSISGDGNTAIIGAYYDDDNAQSNSGSVYIFVRSDGTWTQQQKLTAGTDAANSDYFGRNVSISSDGNTVIVGAYYDDDNGQGNSGSAYIFVRSDGTWTQKQKLTAGADAGSSDYFGWGVSISGDGNTAIIGAYADDDGTTDSGSAYIFNVEKALHISKDIIVDGRIAKTQYKPGEVIEELHSVCNSTSLHGRASIQNVTGTMTIQEYYLDATGSIVTGYVPPIGTKTIVYEYTCMLPWLDAHSMSHWKLYFSVDNSVSWKEVTKARYSRSGYYAEDKTVARWVFSYDAPSADDAFGVITGTPVLCFKWMVRDYSSSNERGYLHQTQYWDGGGTDMYSQPMIMIKALG
jgi:hypothetical protein